MDVLSRLEAAITKNIEQAALVAKILEDRNKEELEYTKESEPYPSIECETTFDIIKAAQKRQCTQKEWDSGDEALKSNFTIVHITDIHNDFQAFSNALSLAKRIDANAIVQTGDIVSYSEDDIKPFETLALNIGVPYIAVLGNHEYSNATYNDEAVYSKFIQPYTSKTPYYLGSTLESYYYYDDTVFKIRFISLNQWVKRNRSQDSIFNYTQEQINWFIDVLKSTPKNYSIFVACHDAIGFEYREEFGEFFMLSKQPSYSFKTQYHTEWFIRDIVDAFISRTTIQKTSSVCTVNADFSDVDPSVDFIAFLTGHRHKDEAGYVPYTENKMINVGMILSCSIDKRPYSTGYYGQYHDMYKSKTNKYSYNAVNIYCVDRDRRVLKIVRYGGNTTVDLRRRLMMEMPYV